MKVGDTVEVRASWMTGMPGEFGRKMEGKVIYVNIPHRHCVVEYTKGQREGFKIVNPAQFASLVKIPEGKHFDAGGYR